MQLKRRPLPPTFKEQCFPLDEHETILLIVKGNMAWIRTILQGGEIQDSPRYVYDVENLLPDVDVSLLSPTEARLQYMTGEQTRIIIHGSSSLSFEEYGDNHGEEE